VKNIENGASASINAIRQNSNSDSNLQSQSAIRNPVPFSPFSAMSAQKHTEAQAQAQFQSQKHAPLHERLANNVRNSKNPKKTVTFSLGI
jgi:hypothetical protein